MTGRATAGVERWIIDERGMYIGAYVWFQADYICVDPVVSGTGAYGGMSTILGNNDGGLTGNEIPRRRAEGGTIGTRYYWASPGPLATSWVLLNPQPPTTLTPYNYVWEGIGQADVGGELNQTFVTISTANPYQGGRHLRVRWLADPAPPFVISGPFTIYAAAATPCNEGTTESTVHRSPVWRVSPGQEVRITYAAMTSTTSGQAGSGGPWARPAISFWKSNMGTLGGTLSPTIIGNPAYSINTTYKTFLWSAVAPADAYWVSTWVGFWRTTTDAVPETFMDLSDYEVTIT